jgi:hypothetical protein
MTPTPVRRAPDTRSARDRDSTIVIQRWTTRGLPSLNDTSKSEDASDAETKDVNNDEPADRGEHLEGVVSPFFYPCVIVSVIGPVARPRDVTDEEMVRRLGEVGIFFGFKSTRRVGGGRPR